MPTEKLNDHVATVEVFRYRGSALHASGSSEMTVWNG